MDHGLDFLGLPRRPGKPRSTGITIVRDWGWGMGEAADVADALGAYLDYVKIRQWAVWYLDKGVTRQKTAIYRRHHITPFPGGIVFEVGYQRGELARTYDALLELGFQAIEISDNIIELSLDDKRRCIGQAVDAGLEVLFEYGKKYAEEAFDVASAAREIQAVTDAGASRVILERSQLDVTLGPGADGAEQGRLVELVDKVGLNTIVFEAETLPHQMWLIRTFGADVNLGPNLTPEEIGLKLEPARYGIGRDEGYSLFEQLTPAAQGAAQGGAS